MREDKLPKLVCLVGYPRSGKTSLCRSWFIPRGYSVVAPDHIRKVIHGRSYVEAQEHFVQAIVYAMVDSLLACGNKVVVDSCNVSRRRREHWVERGAVFCHVDTPLEVCLTRGKGQANACDIVPVIEKLALDWEPLGEGEPQWTPPGITCASIPVPA